MFNPILIRNRMALSKNYFSSFSKTVFVKETVKPPNIVVCGLESSQRMQDYVECIENCLAANSYTVYPVTLTSFLSDPWTENAKALVILDSPFKTSDLAAMKDTIQTFSSTGGKILNFCSTISNYTFTSLSKYQNYSGKLSFVLTNASNQRSLSVHIDSWLGEVIDCSVDEKCLIKFIDDETSDCVACFCNHERSTILSTLPFLSCAKIEDNEFNVLSYLLYCLDLESNWNNAISCLSNSVKSINYLAFLYATEVSIKKDFLERISSNFSNQEVKIISNLNFVSSANYDKGDLRSTSDTEVTVIYNGETEDTSANENHFDWEAYKSCLSTQKFGKLVVYGDVLPTTMDVFDGIISKLPPFLGPIAIAKQQTKGQGRGKNKWLSPIGCAMFTLVVHVPLQSHLGMSLPFLQHLTTIAVVHSIRSLPGLQDINLRVKWPNDVYFGSTVKLGGVIVKSTILRDYCVASIGCGINISNTKPTVCVNDILKDEYSIDRQLKSEEVIARTLSCLEELINNFQSFGSDSFVQLYYKYWLHSNAEVTIEIDSASVRCTVVGVDQFGFLRARRHDNGVVLSLHPDGNSFDIMRNLIASKKS